MLVPTQKQLPLNVKSILKRPKPLNGLVIDEKKLFFQFFFSLSATRNRNMTSCPKKETPKDHFTTVNSSDSEYYISDEEKRGTIVIHKSKKCHICTPTWKLSACFFLKFFFKIKIKILFLPYFF